MKKDTKKQKPPKVARKLALALAKAGAKGQVKKLAAMLKAIEGAGDPGKRSTWEYYARRFRIWLAGGMAGEAPFSIFRAGGNKKLPFLTFSSLPGLIAPEKVIASFGAILSRHGVTRLHSLDSCKTPCFYVQSMAGK